MEHLVRIVFILVGLLLGGCTTPFGGRDEGPSPADTFVHREPKVTLTEPEPLPSRRAFSTPRHPEVVEEILPQMELVEEIVPVGTEYTVEKGDCLFGLAKRFHINFQELLRANNLDEHAQLFVGQRILLPGVDASEIERTAAKKQTHKVKRNECLSKIAKKYGVSVQAIKSANNLKGDRIIEGQNLVIPGSGYVPEPTSKKGKEKPKEKPFVVDEEGYYTLQKNDSLSKVAQKAGVNVRNLQDWNGISDPNKIREGQKILVRAPRAPAPVIPDPVPEIKALPEIESQETFSDPYAFMSDADFFKADDIPIVPVKNPSVEFSM